MWISSLNVNGHRPLGMGGVEKRKDQEKKMSLTVSLHLSALELKEEIA